MKTRTSTELYEDVPIIGGKDPDIKNPDFVFGTPAGKRPSITNIMKRLVNPSRESSGLKPEALVWYEKTFLGIDPEGQNVKTYRVKHRPWSICMPVKNPVTKKLSKGGKKGQIKKASRYIRTERKFKDQWLFPRHILRHLSWTMQNDNTLHKSYYWTIVRAESDKSYPPFIAFDLDVYKDKSGEDKVSGSDSKKKPRHNRKTNDIIRELSETFKGADPLIFSSASGKPNGRHVFFLLEEEVCQSIPLSELKAKVQRITWPILKKHTGHVKFARGSIEFFPDPKFGVILPLGMNSELYTMKGMKPDKYQKRNTGGKGKEPPCPFNSIKYLCEKDKRGNLNKVSLEMINGLYEASVEPVEEKVAPRLQMFKEKKGGTRLNPKGKDELLKVHIHDVPEGKGGTTEFLLRFLIPQMKKYHRDSDNEVDWESVRTSVLAWFDLHRDTYKSDKGFDRWMEDGGAMDSILDWCMNNDEPLDGEQASPIVDVTKEVYQDLIDRVNSDHAKSIFPQETRRVRALLMAGMFLHYCTYIDRNNQNSDIGYQGKDENGLHCYSARVPYDNIQTWKITGTAKGRYLKYVQFLCELNILEMDDFYRKGQIGVEAVCRKYTIKLKHNLADPFTVCRSSTLVVDKLRKEISKKVLRATFPSAYQGYFPEKKSDFPL